MKNKFLLIIFIGSIISSANGTTLSSEHGAEEEKIYKFLNSPQNKQKKHEAIKHYFQIKNMEGFLDEQAAEILLEKIDEKMNNLCEYCNKQPLDAMNRIKLAHSHGHTFEFNSFQNFEECTEYINKHQKEIKEAVKDVLNENNRKRQALIDLFKEQEK